MTKLGWQWLGMAALLVACSDDTTSTGGTGTGGAGGGVSTGAANTGGQASGGNATTGGAGTGGAAPVCMTEPTDSVCVACAKDTCCAQATACLDNPTCAACVACIDGTTDPASCLGNPCDLTDQVTQDAYNCTAAPGCKDSCYPGFDPCAATMSDNMCSTCAKGSCCTEVEACVGSAKCLNCLNCVGNAADPVTCLGNECDIAFDPPTQTLFQCVQMNCPVCTM